MLNEREMRASSIVNIRDNYEHAANTVTVLKSFNVKIKMGHVMETEYYSKRALTGNGTCCTPKEDRRA